MHEADFHDETSPDAFPSPSSSQISYECHSCEHTFSTAAALKKHVASLHASPDQVAVNGVYGSHAEVDAPSGIAGPSYDCIFCEATFSSKALRDAHAGDEHASVCPCCRDSYALCTGEEEQPGHCSVCNVDVHHKTAHVKWLHGSNKCGSCEREFDSPEDLGEHVSMGCKSNGIKPANTMQNGDACNELPTVVSVQSEDEVTAALTAEAQNDREASYKCRFCPSELDSDAECQRHMKNSHWSCMECPEIFGDRETFVLHVQTHVGDQGH